MSLSLLRTSDASFRGDFFVGIIILLILGLGLLQNASTPFLTLAYIFRKQSFPKLERLMTLATAIVYFVVRISIWPYMLAVYGKRVDKSILSAFLSIPTQCKIGFAGMAGMNVVWWVSLVRKILKGDKRIKKE
jgi:hypothetical protein